MGEDGDRATRQLLLIGREHRADQLSLGASQRRKLNELYFTSDPADHFEVRLWLLLRSASSAHTDRGLDDLKDPDALMGKFAALIPEIGFRPGDDEEAAAARGRHAVVIEALSLRHHVAETILRLYRALIVCRPDESPWFEMSSTRRPSDLLDVMQQLLGPSHEQVEAEVTRIAFPAIDSMEDQEGEPKTADTVAAVMAWLRQFAYLLSERGRDMSAANNQIKHGLAIIPSEELLVTFVSEIADPSRPTAEELNAGLPVINGPSIQYLHRERPNAGHHWGWELRTDNVDPALTPVLQ